MLSLSSSASLVDAALKPSQTISVGPLAIVVLQRVTS